MSQISPPAASPDIAGVMPPEAYQQFSSTPPTDNTAAVPTTGATGVYTDADITTVTSSIDPTITNIGYKRTYDNGHAATQKLVATLLFPGFGQSGRNTSMFPDAMAQRMAGYVDPSSGRAPLVLRTETRGRGNGGTIDYARDGQDALDILDHVGAALTANVFGYATNTDGSFKKDTIPAIVVGYSTGALDALNFACRFPDRTLAVVLYYPNYDIGYDPSDSYYMLRPASTRASIAGWVHPGGDLRLTPGAASLDQYLVRNPIDAIARIMALPNGPHVWLLGDIPDDDVLPTKTRLRDAIQGIAGAKAKLHIHLTTTGDFNRILHSQGPNGAGSAYAERYFFPYALKNAAEWTIPQKSPDGDLRLPGWMKTKLFEVWTGNTNNPKSAAGAGGKDHAGELKYDNAARRFRFRPLTTTNGYLQIIREGVKRVKQFTAGQDLFVDLNVSEVITTVADLGFTSSWRADAGVTNSSGVTHWVDNIGGVLDFLPVSNKPALSTDANGKNFIQLTAASSHALQIAQLLLNPLQDFTIAFTYKKMSATNNQYLLDFAHVGSAALFGMQYSSATSGYFLTDSNTWFIQNSNGLGGCTTSQDVIHVAYMTRRNGTAYMNLDTLNGSVPSSPFSATTFTTSGSNKTTIGAGWANGAGVLWRYADIGVYEIDIKQEASSEADMISHFALMKSRWAF